MATLLLRICGPMQSWGTRSRFSERDTEMEPSKSGILGVLCAALGMPRTEPLDGGASNLAGLLMGVRVDHEGTLARDYHTAGGGGAGVRRADGSVSRDAVLSNRYYLAEADFLVGLEGDRRFLDRLDAALRAPRWQLSLGRKSFVPGVPVERPRGGLRDLPLEEALRSEAWPLQPYAFTRAGQPRPRLRYVVERDPGSTTEVRMDQPLGAAFLTRSFGPRWVETLFVDGEE